MRTALQRFVLPFVILAVSPLVAQALEFCREDLNASDLAQSSAVDRDSPPDPIATFLPSALVLEYPSVYDVHNPPVDGVPLRQQPGYFLTSDILNDLEQLVPTDLYHLVLLYSIQEVPGWINSGARGQGSLAMNIGLDNSSYGTGPYYAMWPKLISVPHMNSVEFIDAADLDYGHYGTLVAFHEFSHYWNVFWNRSSYNLGPRGWRPGDPVGALATASYHWSWNWVDTIPGSEDMPGIMYSGALSARFNEFDLYAMGLMSYPEVAPVRHQIWECSPPDYDSCIPGDLHEVGIDDLLDLLALGGVSYYQGDGLRVPETDSSLSSLKTLVVVIKGSDEELSPDRAQAIETMAQGISEAWSTATWERSSMVVAVPVFADGFESADTSGWDSVP